MGIVRQSYRARIHNNHTYFAAVLNLFCSVKLSFRLQRINQNKRVGCCWLHVLVFRRKFQMKTTKNTDERPNPSLDFCESCYFSQFYDGVKEPALHYCCVVCCRCRNCQRDNRGMSERERTVLPPGLGHHILDIVNRVQQAGSTVCKTKCEIPDDGREQADCKTKCENLDKAASSPDSAIDLTEDCAAHCREAGQVVQDLLDGLLAEIVTRRTRKKKREKFSDTEKWNLIKQCGTIGMMHSSLHT